MPAFNYNDPFERIVTDDGRRETKRANHAFQLYALQGVGRSLKKLLNTVVAEGSPDGHHIPVTKSLDVLKKWSARFDWVARADRFDVIEAEKDKVAYESRRVEIMTSGLALTHERLAKLYKIFDQLEKDLKDKNSVWLPDVKSVGSGEFAERVDIVRFNSALFEQARGTLDDIAHEVGGRVKMEKVESSVLNLNVNADDMAKARKTAKDYEKSLLEDDNQPTAESQPRPD